MIVVMFAGKARVGKTTAANLLHKFAKRNDMNPIILPFAKAIKDAAAAAGLTKDTDPKKYRDFCQATGAEKRAENPDYWINMFKSSLFDLIKKDIDNMNDPEKLWKESVIIVDDCRYMNELNFAKSIGAETVFISAGNRELADHNADWRQHESEVLANTVEDGSKDHQDIFKWVVNNDDSEETFTQKLWLRFPLMLGIAPQHWGDQCDCGACQAFYKDKKLSIEDLFDGLG